MRRDIRISSDDLFFWLECEILFKFEVAQCSGERKVSIDTTEFDESTRVCYSRSLFRVGGFVVERERFGLAVVA